MAGKRVDTGMIFGEWAEIRQTWGGSYNFRA